MVVVVHGEQTVRVYDAVFLVEHDRRATGVFGGV